jgi:hypothetical protein
MIKTVYSQELNKVLKSKKSGAGTNGLYKPKLVASSGGAQQQHSPGSFETKLLSVFLSTGLGVKF